MASQIQRWVDAIGELLGLPVSLTDVDPNSLRFSPHAEDMGRVSPKWRIGHPSAIRREIPQRSVRIYSRRNAAKMQAVAQAGVRSL